MNSTMKIIETVFLESLRSLIPDFNQKKFVFTVSGGSDSVAMLQLAKKAGLKGLVAHCHFHLRGEEADGDAEFVKNITKELEYPLELVNFNTKKFAADNGISIQMAARDLRYQWFEKIRKENACDYIIIAHNQDDVSETMLINMLRGTGLRGLSGISDKSSFIIRPMLDISRNDILEYLNILNQDFREDSTNAQTKYLRNKLRHNIIPEFENIQPDFKKRMRENAVRLRSSLDLMNDYVSLKRNEIFEEVGDGQIFVNFNRAEVSVNLLYELLREYGYNYEQISNLYTVNESGKQVYSENYVLLADRSRWILTPIKTDAKDEYFVNRDCIGIDNPIKLSLNEISAKGLKILRDRNSADIDIDKLVFPLILRKWKDGDRFIPLGMSGYQKLSDFFINRKLSLREKEGVWLLCSENDIVWIVGMQIDERYKFSEETKEVLRLNLIK